MDNPAIEQVQTIADITNPLVQRIGNPNLKPQRDLKTDMNYTVSLPGKLSSDIQIKFLHSQSWDKIVTAVNYDAAGRQLISFVNIDDTYDLRGSIFYSTSFKVEENAFMFYVAGNVSHAQDRVLLNETLSGTLSSGVSPELGFKYNKEEFLEMEFNYSPSFNRLRYALNTAANQQYALQNLSGSFATYLFSRLKWKNNVVYQYNNQFPVGLDRSSLLWNMDLAYLFFKNKQGEIKLTGSDLLKQNNNMLRTVEGNFIEDSRSNNLQRYVMLGFAYNFKIMKP